MDDYPFLELFFTMLWLYVLIAWFYFLVIIATDIFRSRDLSGVSKALWVVFLIFVPVIAAVVYLIARGDKMHARQAKDLEEREEALRQRFGGPSPSTADEISKLVELRNSGALSEVEFETQKARLLGA
jgi:membrane protein implicated in regulation of membrane protease activity